MVPNSSSGSAKRPHGVWAMMVFARSVYETVGVGEQRTVLVGEQESRNNGVHAEFRLNLVASSVAI